MAVLIVHMRRQGSAVLSLYSKTLPISLPASWLIPLSKCCGFTDHPLGRVESCPGPPTPWDWACVLACSHRDGQVWGPQPIAASDSTIMAAKQALKRLLPASVCSGWSAYGEFSTRFAKKSTQCLGSVSNIATVSYRLPACRRRSHCRPGSSELAVHARHMEYYFE